MEGFLKLVGVPAEALSRLHQAIEEHGKVNLPYGSLSDNQERRYVSIESSKLADYGTYTVTLKINWSVCAKMQSSNCLGKYISFDFFSYLSMPSFKAIMSTIDSHVLGESEDRVLYGQDLARRGDMDRAERVAELEKLATSLTEKMDSLIQKIYDVPLAQDISTRDGVVVLSKHRGIEKQFAHYLNPLFANHHADFILDGHDDKVRQVLVQIGKIYAPYKKRLEEIEAEFAE